MVHYIKEDDVKKYIISDNDGFGALLENTKMPLRTKRISNSVAYHSVDVHRLMMKQIVDITGQTPHFNQWIEWGHFYDKVSRLKDYERSEHIKDVLDKMTFLVDMIYGTYHISLDYMQVLIKWYLKQISKICDDYEINVKKLKMTSNETFSLPHSSIILDNDISTLLIQALNQFDFYRALGFIKMHPLHHVYQVSRFANQFVVGVLYFLYTVLNTCLMVAKSKSPVPVMIDMTDIKIWSHEMIQILFNVTEEGGVM